MRLNTEKTLLYFGHTEEGGPHTEVVKLMLSLKAQRALNRWKPVNPKIKTVKFSTKNGKIKPDIIQCYALTNDADDEKKDVFYKQLQIVLDKA